MGSEPILEAGGSGECVNWKSSSTCPKHPLLGSQGHTPCLPRPQLELERLARAENWASAMLPRPLRSRPDSQTICPLATGNMVSLNAELEVSWDFTLRIIWWLVELKLLVFSSSFTMTIKNSPLTVLTITIVKTPKVSFKPIFCSSTPWKRVFINVMPSMPGTIATSLISTRDGVLFAIWLASSRISPLRIFFLGPLPVPKVSVWVPPEQTFRQRIEWSNLLGRYREHRRAMRKSYQEDS